MMAPYGGASAPVGWVLCDGASYLQAGAMAALFAVIGTAYGSVDGTHFNVPDKRGRGSIGAGTGVATETFADTAVNLGADTITVASNADKFVTGAAWTLTINSGSITPLTTATQYFVVRNSSTLIQLATNIANAQNGVVINLTATTAGTFTLTSTLSARTRGQVGGEEQHAMSASELFAHTHTIDGGAANFFTTGQNLGNTAPGAGTNAGPLATTDPRGGNIPMNNMQPYQVDNWIIKI
jgi:microcystin-dependent protein